MVSQAKMYAIKPHIMENIEKCYKDRNSHSLLDSPAAIKAFNHFQINSIQVWDCLQSLMKLAEHNRVQLVWVPDHMGIGGNEIDDKLAREGSLHLLIGPEPALAICAEVARGVIRAWTNRKQEQCGIPYVEKGRLRAFLKNC